MPGRGTGNRWAPLALVLGVALATPVAAEPGAGAPIVFARRNPAPQPASLTVTAPARAPAPVRLAPAAPQRPPASAATVEAPEQLYGYGARRNVRAAIDLRGSLGGSSSGEALALDAFDAEDDAAPAPHAAREAVREAILTPVSAPAQTPAPTRPDWLEQEHTGAPYQAMGQWYVPAAEPNYAETGQASWYGAEFAGRRTASGETFDPDALTAAHPTLPMPSLVQITNLENGREVIVRVNDRGPFHGGRLIDVSRRTAEALGFDRQGSARVHVRYLGPAPKRVNADGADAAPPAAPVAAVPAPASVAAQQTMPAGDWIVQVGAFSDPANVARAREALRSAGVVQVDPVGRLQRVRLGAWSSRADAEAARERAAGLGYAGAVVALR